MDEYDIDCRLAEWGFEHKTVCHGHGMYARDEDGDGHYEIHVNTMEGAWSLLQNWLRPHREISQERLILLHVSLFAVDLLTCRDLMLFLEKRQLQ